MTKVWRVEFIKRDGRNGVMMIIAKSAAQAGKAVGVLGKAYRVTKAQD